MKKLLMITGVLAVGLLSARDVVVQVEGEFAMVDVSVGDTLYAVFQELHGVDSHFMLNTTKSTALKKSKSPLIFTEELTALPPRVVGYVESDVENVPGSDLPELEMETVQVQYASDDSSDSDLPDIEIESIEETGSSKREKIFVFSITTNARDNSSYTLNFDNKKISDSSLLSSVVLTVNVKPIMVDVEVINA